MPKPTYSRQVMEEAPSRVLQFLGGVGTSVLIRGALAKVGYTDKDHQEGWSLLHRASGYDSPATDPEVDRAAADAIAELDAWDEPNFRLARAALERRFPEQAGFLFAGLEPAAGAAAVLSVRTFLDRLDALEGKAKGRDHKDGARKQADAAAVALLSGRRITGEERARLRRLVAVAEKGAAPDAQQEKLAAASEAQAEARLQALVDLRAWYDEWAETARVIIKRRDQLIRLGLARRRSAEDGPEPEPEPEPGPTG
ncbi:MAG: hypothetical protein U1A78_27625 [Polyangia bacterium]